MFFIGLRGGDWSDFFTGEVNPPDSVFSKMDFRWDAPAFRHPRYGSICGQHVGSREFVIGFARCVSSSRGCWDMVGATRMRRFFSNDLLTQQFWAINISTRWARIPVMNANDEATCNSVLCFIGFWSWKPCWCESTVICSHLVCELIPAGRNSQNPIAAKNRASTQPLPPRITS